MRSVDEEEMSAEGTSTVFTVVDGTLNEFCFLEGRSRANPCVLWYRRCQVPDM